MSNECHWLDSKQWFLPTDCLPRFRHWLPATCWSISRVITLSTFVSCSKQHLSVLLCVIDLQEVEPWQPRMKCQKCYPILLMKRFAWAVTWYTSRNICARLLALHINCSSGMKSCFWITGYVAWSSHVLADQGPTAKTWTWSAMTVIVTGCHRRKSLHGSQKTVARSQEQKKLRPVRGQKQTRDMTMS